MIMMFHVAHDFDDDLHDSPCMMTDPMISKNDLQQDPLNGPLMTCVSSSSIHNLLKQGPLFIRSLF